jgi:hypothetical protein
VEFYTHSKSHFHFPQLVENDDCLFDDGVAPELALDFDSQHISSGEALLTWAGALTGLGVFWFFLRSSNPEGKNPAVNRKFDLVVPEPPTGPPTQDS